VVKNRTKVLLVIRQLILGGAESQTYELARGLDRDRFEVVVCSLQDGGHFAGKLEAEGIPVRVVLKRWRYDVSVVPRLVALFRRERPEIVHCVMWTANMWGGLAARLAGVPRLVLSTRSLGIWKGGLHYLTGPWTFNRADVVLANSGEVRNYMVQREGVHPERIQVIYNGLDPDRFGRRFSREQVKRLRLELGLPSAGPVVGTVANLLPQKDYPTLLHAAAQVVRHNPAACFLLIGDGPLRAQLETATARLGLSGRVVFAGQRNDVERCLACLDVFILCSVREGFSNALIEAMAAGLPVIATRVGGNLEAVREGDSGFLFEVGDDETLARLILRLIGNPEEAGVLGEQGRTRARREFGMTEYLRRMATLYTDVLGEVSP
jgi:glycosyltransferase involved in cell wall biosynthesis